MNQIMISNAKVLEYSNANPCGFVKKENQYGVYCCFRILEKNYNTKPIPWFCIANNGLAEKIEKMSLTPGDEIIVSGSAETYFDEERNRESYRIIIQGIDYNYAAKKKHKEKNTPTKPATNSNMQSGVTETTINLDECDLFQKEINIK